MKRQHLLWTLAFGLSGQPSAGGAGQGLQPYLFRTLTPVVTQGTPAAWKKLDLAPISETPRLKRLSILSGKSDAQRQGNYFVRQKDAYQAYIMSKDGYYFASEGKITIIDANRGLFSVITHSIIGVTGHLVDMDRGREYVGNFLLAEYYKDTVITVDTGAALIPAAKVWYKILPNPKFLIFDFKSDTVRVVNFNTTLPIHEIPAFCQHLDEFSGLLPYKISLKSESVQLAEVSEDNARVFNIKVCGFRFFFNPSKMTGRYVLVPPESK